MTAGQGGALESCLFPEEVRNKGYDMVGETLTGRYVPSLYEWSPIEVHTHNVIDVLGNFGKSVCADGTQCMKQFFAYRISILLQTGNEGHFGYRHNQSFATIMNGAVINFLAINVEEDSTIAQSHANKVLGGHKALNIKGN